jgi:hypothetical protein
MHGRREFSDGLEVDDWRDGDGQVNGVNVNHLISMLSYR